MLTTTRAMLAAQRDASRVVKQAEKFSVRVPLVGRVSVPPPDQLAFFAILGVLAAVEAIDWPVALAIGVGQAVVARHFTDQPSQAAAEQAPAARKALPRKASAAKKAAPRKAAKGTKATK